MSKDQSRGGADWGDGDRPHSVGESHPHSSPITHDSSPITHHSFPGWSPSFQAALERLSVAVRQPSRGQHAGAVRSRVRGRALEFADYRPYTAGDDPRLVDWRAYARLGRLYLKQYEEERARTLTMLLDASASLDWGKGDAHKGLFARRVAAALAWVAVGRHEPVRTFLLRDGDAASLPPISSRGGAVALFRQLGSVGESGATGLSAAVQRGLRGRRPGPVVLLSDLLDGSWPEALEALAATGEGAVIQLLAPDEWEPPLGEEVELEDSETGEVRAGRLGPVELAAYRQRLEQFLAEVRERCLHHSLLHLAINTGTPLQEVVLRQLPATGILQG